MFGTQKSLMVKNGCLCNLGFCLKVCCSVLHYPPEKKQKQKKNHWIRATWKYMLCNDSLAISEKTRTPIHFFNKIPNLFLLVLNYRKFTVTYLMVYQSLWHIPPWGGWRAKRDHHKQNDHQSYKRQTEIK